MLRAHYQKVGISSKEIFSGIKDVIIKSLISIEPHIVNNFNRYSKYKNTCFEVYGFDVIIDAKLKSWILEVNVCPSFSSSSFLDKKVKTMMLSDAFHCIGIIPFDRK
jgi:tubulin polyglutamylase TTLL4